MIQPQKKIFLFNGLVALAIAGLYFFLSESPWAKDLIRKQYDRRIIAKEFTLPVIGKEPGEDVHVSLADLKGAPTVISFWASWCNVCRSETPHLRVIAGDLKSLGLKPILAIASYDNGADVRETERFKSGEFRFVLDKNGDVAQLWKVRGLPHTFILDQEGTVRLSVSGLLTEMKLDEIRLLLTTLSGKTAH